jgi:hypothetical protein
MIVPLKIIVFSLKSLKQLLGVQNDTLVMNTPASLNSPVINTPESQLLGVFGTSIRTGLQRTLW